MNKLARRLLAGLGIFLAVILLMGCADEAPATVEETAVSQPTAQPTAVPMVVKVEETAVPIHPSPTPEPVEQVKELRICIAGWAQRMDMYEDQSYTAVSIAYIAAHQEAMHIFAQEVPIVPLFYRLKVAVTRPEVMNFKLNTTRFSDLWNLYELDLVERE
ncbi:MAG: hypothetical protein GY943_12180 [Chloroflexi bacterium]|nr:hypothetical protein [Chloroflexota bacterium]